MAVELFGAVCPQSVASLTPASCLGLTVGLLFFYVYHIFLHHWTLLV